MMLRINTRSTYESRIEASFSIGRSNDGQKAVCVLDQSRRRRRPLLASYRYSDSSLFSASGFRFIKDLIQ